MTLVLVALGAFIAGSAVATIIGRHWFHVGIQMGRDARWLDHGPDIGRLSPDVPEEDEAEVTGEIPRVVVEPVAEPVGESSGRHSMDRLWPANEPTEKLVPVAPEVKA